MGLLDAFKQYISDIGGSLNPEIGGLLAQTGETIKRNARQRDTVMKGLLADPSNRDLQRQAVAQGLDMASIAPIGMTVWHGSPHKFTKFDMSKIGTGEGAQAYGHGLYTAELPEVAQQYQQFGSWQHRANGQAQPVMFKDAPVQFDKMGNVVGDHPKGLKMFLSRVASKGDYDAALNEVKQTLSDMKAAGSFPSIQDDLAEEIAQATANKSRIKASGAQGNLYKVDIPDEAVARMLDWDKPLSQQAPEVQKMLQTTYGSDIFQKASRFSELQAKYGDGLSKHEFDEWLQLMRESGENPGINALSGTGRDFYKEYLSKSFPDATAYLKQNGIPGIRYLDGGSRSAGQGSSNFVAFSPDLIRILERNGIATGEKPWAPGEWSGLLGK